MKQTAVVVAILYLLLSTVCVGQTHLFPATDSNNVFTGTNAFTNTFSLTALANGCLQVSGGVVNSTGLSCGAAGSGTVVSVSFTGDGTVLSSTPTAPVTISGTLTAVLANAPAGMVLNNAGATSVPPGYTNSVVLGLNGGGGYTGKLTLLGTSGGISVGVPNAAGTPHTLLLPVSNGSSGQFLQTDGGSPAQLTWAATGTGTVTVTGSPAAHQPAIFSGATSITGASAGAADTIFMGNDSGATADPAFKAGPSGGTNGCAGTTDTPTYNTSTHVWGCHQISSSTGPVTSVTFTGDGTMLSSTPSSAVTTSGTLTATLATAAHDTVFGNVTSGTAAGAYTASPAGGTNGCSGSTDTAIYTAGTGWGCHQITRAAALYVAIPSTTRGDFTIAHGLGAVPNNVDVKMVSDGLIRFQPSPSPPWDATYVYLNASDDGLTGLLVVEP